MKDKKLKIEDVETPPTCPHTLGGVSYIHNRHNPDGGRGPRRVFFCVFIIIDKTRGTENT